jgi:carboxyl-terminal processing protease
MTLRSAILTAALAAFMVPAALPERLPAQAPQSRAQEPITRDQALVTFDSAWRRIGMTHYDSAMRGVDWNAVRDSLRPRAAASGTLGELRQTIGAMLATLGESHFVLIPQEAADALDPDRSRQETPATPGDVGVTLRLLGDTVIVTAVRPSSAAARAGVQPGWIVDSVGRFSAVRTRRTIAERHALTRRELVAMIPQGAASQFAGAAGSTVTAVFTDGSGRPQTIELVREPLPGYSVRFGNLPTMYVEAGQSIRPLASGGCAGVIRLSVWMLPATAQLDSAVDAVRHCKGVIIDLRGNPGGVGGMVMGFGGHFLDSAYVLGEMKTRSNRLRFVANPRRADVAGRRVTPFAGALAIVVDSLSMSTSEIFAAGMQAIGRARVFGENTPGLALPAVMLRLPTGDVLMHVFADFTDPAGRRIEGVGAVPDVSVPLTRANLLNGIDAPLEAALAWISGSRQ